MRLLVKTVVCCVAVCVVLISSSVSGKKRKTTNRTIVEYITIHNTGYTGQFISSDLKEMFPSHEVWLLSVLFGAIGGIITVLFVKMWENNGAAEVRENRVPQEHDERFG